MRRACGRRTRSGNCSPNLATCSRWPASQQQTERCALADVRAGQGGGKPSHASCSMTSLKLMRPLALNAPRHFVLLFEQLAAISLRAACQHTQQHVVIKGLRRCSRLCACACNHAGGRKINNQQQALLRARMQVVRVHAINTQALVVVLFSYASINTNNNTHQLQPSRPCHTRHPQQVNQLPQVARHELQQPLTWPQDGVGCGPAHSTSPHRIHPHRLLDFKCNHLHTHG